MMPDHTNSMSLSAPAPSFSRASSALGKVDAHVGDDVLAGRAVGPSVEQPAQVREEGLCVERGADGGVAQKHAVGQRDGEHEQEGQEVLDARVVRLRVQPLQQRALHALPIEQE